MILETICTFFVLAMGIMVIGFLIAVIFLVAETFYKKLKSIIERISEVAGNE